MAKDAHKTGDGCLADTEEFSQGLLGEVEAEEGEDDVDSVEHSWQAAGADDDGVGVVEVGDLFDEMSELFGVDTGGSVHCEVLVLVDFGYFYYQDKASFVWWRAVVAGSGVSHPSFAL